MGDAATGYSFRDHFLTGDSPGLATASGNIGLGWYSPATSDFAIQRWPGEENHPGVLLLSTSTTANAVNGSMALTGVGTTTQFTASNVQQFRAQVRTPVSLDSMSIIVGFGSEGHTASNADDLGAHGVFFLFNSGNARWRGATQLNSVNTAVSGSGPLVLPSTWYILEARVGGGEWEFFVNGVLIGTVATNVPTTQLVTPICKFRKAATAAAVIRSYQVDEYFVLYDLSGLSGEAGSIGVPDPVTGPTGPSGPAGPVGATGPSGALASLGSKIVNIADFGATPGGNVSTQVRTANTVAIQAAIDALLEDTSNSSLEGRGGEILIPPGVWEINDAIGIDVSIDYVSGLCVRGVGDGYACQIRQADGTKVAFKVKGGTQNVRGVTLRDFTIKGGDVGLELTNDNYNLFQNLLIYGQTSYAVKAAVLGGFGSLFQACRFQHLTGNTVKIVSGVIRMVGCMIGENAGAFEIGGGRLHLEGCTVFDSKEQLGLTDFGQGNALFYMTNGSTLHISGGYIEPGAVATCVVFITHGRDVLISGTDVVMHAAMTDFIVDYQASNGPKPFAVLHARPIRVRARNPSGVSMYREINHTVSACHKNAVIDTIVEYVTTPPTTDAAWQDVGNNNMATLRERPDNSI